MNTVTWLSQATSAPVKNAAVIIASGLISPVSETMSAANAPAVTYSAWAKFGSRMTLKVRVMPSAINAYKLPFWIVLTIEVTNNAVGMPLLACA